MQKHILLILFLFVSRIASTQFYLETSQVYGGNSTDEATDIITNNDSTALFFGARSFSSDADVPGNAGGSDFWISKRDLFGNLIWNKNYGGLSNDDLGALMAHSDGGLLAFGTTRNDHGVNGDLLGQSGAWLIRTNNAGTLIKGKIFGGPIAESGIDAVRHKNGSVTMLIEASSPELEGEVNHGILDVWVVQVDANFTLKWSVLLGGSRQDSPVAITTDENGNIYVAATSQSNLPGLGSNVGAKDLWVFKLDPLGEMLWQKNFGGTGDDIANDIQIDTVGNVFVLTQSTSSDGHFITNRGISDLWLIKLNGQNGDPLFFKNYGGEQIEANGNLSWLGSDRLVISVTSNSDTFALSSNKGFNDVWVFSINLSGVIQQEMNYGGSLNDFAADLVTIDSVIYLLNSTFSTEKNVPANALSQSDVWFMSLNTNPRICSEQLVCLQDSTVNNEILPPSNNSLICVTGCTAGQNAGPQFNQGACSDFNFSTVYFRLTTDALADLLTINFVSHEFNEPYIAILRSGNCTSFTQIACATGADGNLSLPFVEVDPLRTYIIAISDNTGNVGDFEMCVSVVDVENCNEKDSLYVTSASKGSPLSGPFLPGERVQICYELQDWNKLECNGFQGLIPSFGPGWDSTGFDASGMPLQMDLFLLPTATGFWDWHIAGDVHYNFTNSIAGFEGGQGLPAGWYFTNTADPPPNNGPDETIGDIDDCLPTPDTWKVCFTLPVEDNCQENMDLSINMRTLADGEIGVNLNVACVYDQVEKLDIRMVCCNNPTIQQIPLVSVCSEDTLIIHPNTNILDPVTFSWISDPDIGVEGSTSGNQKERFFQILTNETDDVLNVNYILWAEGDNCAADPITFTVRVYPNPTSRISISGPNTVCSGSKVTFNFESTGTPPFAIELTRDNIFFANVLSETSNFSIDIDPILSGRFRIGSVSDAVCEGEGQGFVNVVVNPVASETIDTSLCQGETITVGHQTFGFPGSYIIRLIEEAENGCDSIISLTLNLTPSFTDVINEQICNGDTFFLLGQPYTETTNQIIEYIGPLGCPNYYELHLIVRDTFIDEFNQTICGGDTLEFEDVVLYESGTYSHVEEVTPGCFAKTILNLIVLPEIEINDLSIIADNGNNSGAIVVEITGGSPPYTYVWNTGQVTGSIFNIVHGNYSVSVTDRNGCSKIFTFVVPMGTATYDAGSHQDIKVWPTLFASGDIVYVLNPNSPILQFSEIALWDTNGRVITQINQDELVAVSSSLTSFSFKTQVPPGLYLIRLSTEDGNSSWHKVVID